MTLNTRSSRANKIQVDNVKQITIKLDKPKSRTLSLAATAGETPEHRMGFRQNLFTKVGNKTHFSTKTQDCLPPATPQFHSLKIEHQKIHPILTSIQCHFLLSLFWGNLELKSDKLLDALQRKLGLHNFIFKK